MADDDVRALFDPIAILRAARPKFREVPEQTYTPPATAGDPDPAPVTVPARTEVYTDPADLPDEVKVDGTVDLITQLGIVQAGLARVVADLQIRTVFASTTLAPTVPLTLAAGSTRDVALTWATPPLAHVLGAVARLDVGVAWQGKVTGHVKDGSVTDTGCTVTVTVVGVGTVVITTALPLTVNADGLYLYWPPYTGS